MRQRLRASWPVVALGLAVAAVTSYVLTIALDTTAFLNDEYGTVIGGRLLARDPLEVLTSDAAVFNRGPERLTPFLLSIPDMVLTSTPAQMRAGHVLLALAYALVAVPTFALLRGLGVPRWPAVALAVTAIVGPWIVFGVTLLNVTIAAPLTVAFAWAAWRAAVRPSIPAELLCVGLAVLMTLARTSHGVFFGAAVLAALAAGLWSRPDGEAWRRAPARIVRRTPIIAGVTALGLLALVVAGPDALAGRDYAQAARLRPPLDPIWDKLVWTTAVVTIATGFLAVPIGVAWMLRQIARPAELGAGVFAVIALAIMLLFVYVAGAAEAQEQERYPAALAAFPIIALGAALFRRETWFVGTAVVGVLSARAVATRGIEPNAESLNYFFDPARLFFSRAVVERMTTVISNDAVVTVVLTAVVLVAAAVALFARWRPVAWAAVVAVLGLGVIAGEYTLRKYEPATRPGDLDAQAWIDPYVRDGESAVVWYYSWASNDFDRGFFTRLALFHNDSACCAEWSGDVGEMLTADAPPDAEHLKPEVVAGFSGYRPVVLAAREVARPQPYGEAPMRVQRFVGKPAAAALITGVTADGLAERTARIDTLPPLADRCIDVQLYGREDAAEPVGFQVARERGRLRPGEVHWIRIRGDVALRRTGRGDAPLMVAETRFVDCGDPLSS